MTEETGRQRKKTQRSRRLRVPLDEVPRQSASGIAEPDVPIEEEEVVDEERMDPGRTQVDMRPPPMADATAMPMPDATAMPLVDAKSTYRDLTPPGTPDTLDEIAPEAVAPMIRDEAPRPSRPSSSIPPGDVPSVVTSRVVITGVPPAGENLKDTVHAPTASPVPRELRFDGDDALEELDVVDEGATPAVETRKTDPDGESGFGDEASTDISIEESPMESGGGEVGFSGGDDEDALASEPTVVRAPRSDLPEEPTKPRILTPEAVGAKSEPPPRPVSERPRPVSERPKPLSQPPPSKPLSLRPPPVDVPSIVIDPSLTDEETHEPEPEEARTSEPPDEPIEPEEEAAADSPAAAASSVIAPPPPSSPVAAAAPPPPPTARAVPPVPPPAAAKGRPPPPAKQADTGPYREAAPREQKRKAWWETFFNDDYLRTVRPPRPAQVMRQVNFIEYVLGLQPGGTVLDVGCGLGLQAVELSSRGFLVVGVDLSLPMLSRAADEAQDAGQKINFLHADMRELSFDGTFDAVMSLGTSFGYFDEETNKAVLERMKKALKPGGVLLLDMVNRDFLLQQQPNLVWFEGDGCVCMEETNFNYITSRLHVKRTVILDDGRQRESEYAIRLYTLNELGQILHHMGFRVMEVSGTEATPGVYFGAFSPKLIILAEKRADMPMTVSGTHKASPSQPDFPKTEVSGTVAVPPKTDAAAGPKTPPPPPIPKDDE